MRCFVYNSYQLHFGPDWLLTPFLNPFIILSIIQDVCPSPDQHPSRPTSPSGSLPDTYWRAPQHPVAALSCQQPLGVPSQKCSLYGLHVRPLVYSFPCPEKGILIYLPILTQKPLTTTEHLCQHPLCLFKICTQGQNDMVFSLLFSIHFLRISNILLVLILLCALIFKDPSVTIYDLLPQY